MSEIIMPALKKEVSSGMFLVPKDPEDIRSLF
jgi:hypothetical protein